MARKKNTAPKQENHTPMTFEMACISHPKEIGKIETFLNRLNKKARLDDGTFYRLFVSSTEAVNNGILHGNKSDPKKKVCLSCSINTDSIVIRVTDEGKGFDPSRVPNPLEDQNLLKESGRGIFLIRSMTDKVKFVHTGEGTTVEMTIDLKRLR